MKGPVVALLCIVAAAFAACKEEPKPGEQAAKAAVEGYGHLIAGRYADYLAAVAGADSLPAAYREQLLAGAKQFMARQREEHGGIARVSVVKYVADSVARQTNVFLLLCFGDSTREEVVVPMVEGPSGWRMK